MKFVTFIKDPNPYLTDAIGISDALSVDFQCMTFRLGQSPPVFDILDSLLPDVIIVAETAMSKSIPQWIKENDNPPKVVYLKSPNKVDNVDIVDLHVLGHDKLLPAVNLGMKQTGQKQYMLGHHGFQDWKTFGEIQALAEQYGTQSFKVFNNTIWRTEAYGGDLSKPEVYSKCFFVYVPKIKIEDYFEIIQYGAIPVSPDVSALPAEFTSTVAAQLDVYDFTPYEAVIRQHNYHARAIQVLDILGFDDEADKVQNTMESFYVK